MKTITKLFALTLCLALLLTALPAAAEGDDSLQKILNKGEMVLGLDAAFPPMGYTADDGEIVGFDIDVAKEVCARLGVALKCQPINWLSKDLELNNFNIDCIWNGMTINPERLEAMSISLPYLLNKQVLAVRQDSGIKTLADLAGKKVGLQSASSAEDALNAAADFKASLGEVIPFDDNAIALMDLDIGGVDAVLLDVIVANYYITTEQAPYVVLEEALAPEEYGIGFRKADLALTEAVNDALLAMAADGTLAQISENWFGEDITVVAQYAAQ